MKNPDGPTITFKVLNYSNTEYIYKNNKGFYINEIKPSNI